MGRFRDFDQAVAALEPLTFRVAGRDYTLEQDPPAATILNMIRANLDEDPEMARDLIEELVGKENLEQMLQDGATFTQLAMLSRWIAEESGLADDNTKGGNGAVPKSRSKTSSKTGR